MKEESIKEIWEPVSIKNWQRIRIIFGQYLQ